MKDSNRLTEAELHALADGLLTAEERADAEARLAAYPEDASKVTEWRDQNAQIRAAFAPYAAARAADADLIKPKGRRSFWGPSIAKKMAGVAVFAIGIAIGHYGPRFRGRPGAANRVCRSTAAAGAGGLSDLRERGAPPRGGIRR